MILEPEPDLLALIEEFLALVASDLEMLRSVAPFMVSMVQPGHKKRQAAALGSAWGTRLISALELAEAMVAQLCPLFTPAIVPAVCYKRTSHQSWDFYTSKVVGTSM